MPQIKSVFAIMLLGVLLGACSSIHSSNRIAVNSAARWVVLPIHNLSSTPMAGDAAKSLIESRLRNRGVQQLVNYESTDKLTLTAALDSSSGLSSATQWAQQQGYQYGITGTIHEWQYKIGTDKEPVVGLSLKLIDLKNDSVLWQNSDAKTGWGFANLTGVADVVIGRLLDQVDIMQPLAYRTPAPDIASTL